MKLWSLLGNSQRLDGGAMFGNAPRAMWAKWMAPDAANRIPLACRALLASPLAGKTVLFEAGHVYHFAGDEAAARSYWTRALAADPRGKSGQAAKEALAMLDKPVVQSEAPATK